MFVRSEDGLITDEAPARIERFDYYSAAKQWRVYGKNGFCMAEYGTPEEALARMDDVNAWLDAKPYEDDPQAVEGPPVKALLGGCPVDMPSYPIVKQAWKWLKPRVYRFDRPIGYWKEGVK